MVNGGDRGPRQNVVRDRSYAFALSIIRTTRELRRRREFELASQLLRAGTSIGAHVEEAQAAQTKADFVAKMSGACKEAREASYWLRLLRDSDALPPEAVKPMVTDAATLIRILTAIVKSGQESLRKPSVERRK